MKTIGLFAAVVLISAVSVRGDDATTQPTQRTRDTFRAGLTLFRNVPADKLPAEIDRFLAQRLQVPTWLDEDAAYERRREVLIGLAAVFDGYDTLANNVLTRGTFSGICRENEKAVRKQISDKIEFAGRNDAGRHFFLSIGLTASLGPFLAERVGRAKEIHDAQRFDENPGPGQQGYSFVDLAYDLAGIAYAQRLLEPDDAGSDRSQWQDPLPVASYTAPLAKLDLPEMIGWKKFQKEYAGENHAKFEKLVASIRAAIAEGTKPTRAGSSDGKAAKKSPSKETKARVALSE